MCIQTASSWLLSSLSLLWYKVDGMLTQSTSSLLAFGQLCTIIKSLTQHILPYIPHHSHNSCTASPLAPTHRDVTQHISHTSSHTFHTIQLLSLHLSSILKSLALPSLSPSLSSPPSLPPSLPLSLPPSLSPVYHSYKRESLNIQLQPKTKSPKLAWPPKTCETPSKEGIPLPPETCATPSEEKLLETGETPSEEKLLDLGLPLPVDCGNCICDIWFSLFCVKQQPSTSV